MSPLDRGRSWIWAAVIVEIIGLSVDAVWHGLIGAAQLVGEVWHAY